MYDEVKERIKTYILNEFLPGEDPTLLTDETPLMTGGILDSISTLKLVVFLEQNFDIRIDAHEVDRESLETLSRIAQLVISKLRKS